MQAEPSSHPLAPDNPAPRPALLGVGRATGKLILAGEHAVVYGHGALAVPVPGVEAVASLWRREDAAECGGEGIEGAAGAAGAAGTPIATGSAVARSGDASAMLGAASTELASAWRAAVEASLAALSTAAPAPHPTDDIAGATPLDVSRLGQGLPVDEGAVTFSVALSHLELPPAAWAALGHAAGRASWQLDVCCGVPLGRGMGSSAAMAVAVVRAVAAAAGRSWDAATTAGLALTAERVTHGRPSGIDTTVIAEGQPIWFQRGHGESVVVGAPLLLVIADSGRAGSTKAMVAAVQSRFDAAPQRVGAAFAAIGELAAAARLALAAGRIDDLGALFTKNHHLLQTIGVSTPALDALVEAAIAAGASGAKLSGAGGGGVVVALADAVRRDAVKAALAAAGASRVLESTVRASGE